MTCNKSILKISLLAFSLGTTLFSCAQDDKQKSTPLYDLSKFEKYQMPDILQEISGFAFANGDTSKIYAQQDEDGSVFVLPIGTKDDKETKFAKKGDYEDMAIVDNTIVVLKSNGNLYAFPIAEMGKQEAGNVVDTKDLLPKGEYEGLFADPTSQQIYVLCKDCKIDKGKDKQVTIYVLGINANKTFKMVRNFAVNVEQLNKFTGKKKGKVHPSALAQHPINKDWYIVSGVNKALMIFDAQWKMKGAYHLNSNDFNQPEGIAFDKDGNMFISNEGSETTLGNILRFNLKHNK